jgi:enoyl-CoA hydratase/carnithine racemase
MVVAVGDAGEFESTGLELDEQGVPASPMLIVPLENWVAAGHAEIRSAARKASRALPVTVGISCKPLPGRLQPLLEALTLTLISDDVTGTENAGPPAPLIPVADVGQAVSKLSASVAHSPQASLALNRLLRQTSMLTVIDGLAAEAAVYSMLLGGPEFGRWLAQRDSSRHKAVSSRPPVRVRREGSRLSIVLDRPERRNALSADLRDALFEALWVAVADLGIEHVEISGAGPAFCSGGDLSEFGTARDLAAAYFVRLDRAPWRLIDQVRDRTEVRLHGACIGAGVEMAAFAGVIRASPGSYFHLPEVGMGLVPGAGGTVSVTRRIGRWRAAWMMLTGARLDSVTALRWGLIDKLTTENLSMPGRPRPG